MAEDTVVIRVFDAGSAGEPDFAAWNRCSNRLRAEAWPEDRPVSLEQTRRNLLNMPPFARSRRWAAWSADGEEIVGQAAFTIWETGSNAHAAGSHLAVLPEWRRMGIGTLLLRRIVEGARAEGRRLLLGGTLDRVPAGEAFARRLGARAGNAGHVNQLDLRESDPEALRALLRAWQERGRRSGDGFELGVWEGPYPEEATEEVARMKEAQNLMPRGDLEMEDEKVTPEQVRQTDASMLRRGWERWTVYLRDPAAARIAGYTEVFWHPEHPELLHQEDTAVFPEYQNRGFGRWLKAVMLEKVLRDRPQVVRIRTGNADSNAPMLKINREMGFKPYAAHTDWQVEVDLVEARLAGR